MKAAEIWDRLRKFSLREQEMRTVLVCYRKWKEAAWLEMVRTRDEAKRWSDSGKDFSV